MVALMVALKLAAAHEEPQQDILDNFIYGDDVQAIEDLRYTIETTCDNDVKCAFDNVWSFMDITGDGQLSLAEISRFQRVIIKYWVVEQQQAALAERVDHVQRIVHHPRGDGGEIVAQSRTLGDELIVADCDLDACTFGKETVFNFAAHRRIEHYGLITERAGAIPPYPKER